MDRKVAAAIALLAGMLALPMEARPLKAEQEAKIKPSGPAVDCISIPEIRNTRVRDDRTIDFYTSGNKVYRNTLPYACSGLGFEEKFSYSTSLSRLCSVDVITVLHSSPAMSGPSCGLGKFQPVTGAPK